MRRKSIVGEKPKVKPPETPKPTPAPALPDVFLLVVDDNEFTWVAQFDANGNFVSSTVQEGFPATGTTFTVQGTRDPTTNEIEFGWGQSSGKNFDVFHLRGYFLGGGEELAGLADETILTVTATGITTENRQHGWWAFLQPG